MNKFKMQLLNFQSLTDIFLILLKSFLTLKFLNTQLKRFHPNTVIIQFEDETYGNFPFRFLNSQDAKEYSKKFQECNYDKESIKILHEEHVRKRNAGVLTYRGEAKARLEQKLQNQNRGKKYDKQSSFSW